MKRGMKVGVTFLLLFVLVVAHGFATQLGIGIGLDPTGVLLIGALAEISFGNLLDLRAQLGVATQNMAGLLMLGGAVLLHQQFPPFDPYIGGGIGLALTPGFSTGFTAEGLVGTRVALFGPTGAFLQVRIVARLSEIGWTAGPLYEAGLLLSF